jgi:hypothetical protein
MTSEYSDVITYLINKRMLYTPDTFNHIACVIPINQYCHKTIGINSDKTQYGNTIIKTHAEMDAVLKMKYFVKNKIIKKNKMDLIVLRLNREGKLCLSAPCYHCTCFLDSKKTRKLIKINRIFYSNQYETITSIKFEDWVEWQKCNKHISRCWKNWIT